MKSRISMHVPAEGEDPAQAGLEWIQPDWAVPTHVRALTTTRTGGFSLGPYAGLNLADHVGDDPCLVARNRALLVEALGIRQPPCWLHQVHGRGVWVINQRETANSLQTAGTKVDAPAIECSPEADACVTRQPGQVCTVLTADCLPVLLSDDRGTVVAAVHAGWRGLHAGVIDAAVAAMRCPAARLHAWLGPAIGAAVYEVGTEVRQAFLSLSAEAESAFTPTRDGHYLADLYRLARQRLSKLGVEKICGGDHCSLSEPDRFYSYRRDGRTGRMASLIWIQPH